MSYKTNTIRWGITAEQAQSGEVLDICLSEIDRCTYFINILGSRYGWIPNSFPVEVVNKFSWLRSLKTGEKSVTELEGTIIA